MEQNIIGYMYKSSSIAQPHLVGFTHDNFNSKIPRSCQHNIFDTYFLYSRKNQFRYTGKKQFRL